MFIPYGGLSAVSKFSADGLYIKYLPVSSSIVTNAGHTVLATTDAASNLYFGGGAIVNIFIEKYDADGNEVWHIKNRSVDVPGKPFANLNHLTGIVVDPTMNNIYITGIYRGHS